MAVFFKTIMGEISSLVDKYWKMTAKPTEDSRLHDLKRLLLRIRVIVEEAEGRHVTNRAMLYQLNLLRKEMYRGYFTVDNFKSQGTEAKSHDVSALFALSKFNPAKRLYFSSNETYGEKDLQKVLDSLANIMDAANELVMLLKNYPPLYRQPYSMHLFIGKCMFGRQMEMERIIDFLMQKENASVQTVGILPLVGPTFVGKSTLVAHVCNDVRVLNCFSRIMVITRDEEANNESRSNLTDGDVIIPKINALGTKNERMLAVIELSGNIDDVTWNNLYLSCGVFLGRGSKMIVTSRSNKIIRFGTTPALVLNFLPPEAYWYFFKILTFGTMDSNDNPELESIALEIGRGLSGSFVSANIISGLLKNNPVAQRWRSCAYFRKGNQRNVPMFDDNTRASYHTKDGHLMICDKKRTCLDEENVPKVTIEDVFDGRVKCERELDVLLWKSQIPPYKSCVVSCMVKKSQ